MNTGKLHEAWVWLVDFVVDHLLLAWLIIVAINLLTLVVAYQSGRIQGHLDAAAQEVTQ